MKSWSDQPVTNELVVAALIEIFRQVYFFEGSYTEYEENKKKRLGDNTPKRVKYKKLVAD